MLFYKRLLPACRAPWKALRRRKPHSGSRRNVHPLPSPEPLALHCQRRGKLSDHWQCQAMAWSHSHHLVTRLGQSHLLETEGLFADKAPSKGTRARNNVLKSNPGQPSEVREMSLQSLNPRCLPATQSQAVPRPTLPC